jgi:hypothetical protein
MLFRKKFARLVAYPFLAAFTEHFLAVPSMFFAAWCRHKCPRSLSFAWIPREVICFLGVEAVIESLIAIMANVGYFASDLDFLMMMRLTKLVCDAAFGVLLLGERLTASGACSVAVVVTGIAIVISNFQWSVVKMTSIAQIVVQVSVIVLTSLDSFIIKKVVATPSFSHGLFTIVDLMAWAKLASLPSIFMASFWKDHYAWNRIREILTPGIVLFAFGGIVLQTSFWLCLMEFHRFASMISLGILTQLRVTTTLVVSYFVYRQTVWNTWRLFGFGLLVTGGVCYLMSKETVEKKAASPDDELNLMIEGEDGKEGVDYLVHV